MFLGKKKDSIIASLIIYIANHSDIKICKHDISKLFSVSIVTSLNPTSDCEQLVLSTTFKGGYPNKAYNFETSGTRAISLSPGDINSTVYVGDVVIYSDTNNVYLTSFTKNLSLVTDEMTLDGTFHSLNNLKIEGEVYTPEDNITRKFNDTISSSNLFGYAFRIDDNQLLELIEYKHNDDNIENDACQLVATFGKGNLTNDTNFTFNSYDNTDSSHDNIEATTTVQCNS